MDQHNVKNVHLWGGGGEGNVQAKALGIFILEPFRTMETEA
jgi:hypothetical protein